MKGATMTRAVRYAIWILLVPAGLLAAPFVILLLTDEALAATECR